MPLLGAFVSLCNILSYIHKNCEHFCVGFQEKYNRKLLVYKTVLNKFYVIIAQVNKYCKRRSNKKKPQHLSGFVG